LKWKTFSTWGIAAPRPNTKHNFKRSIVWIENDDQLFYFYFGSGNQRCFTRERLLWTRVTSLLERSRLVNKLRSGSEKISGNIEGERGFSWRHAEIHTVEEVPVAAVPHGLCRSAVETRSGFELAKHQSFPVLFSRLTEMGHM
jgi:hypothetical protein